MSLRRSTLTLIFIYVILFFALCAKPISSVDQNNDGTKMTIAELERIKPDFGMQKLSVDDDGTQMAISMLEGFIPYIESWKTWFAAKGACNLIPPEIKNCCVQCQEKNLCDAVNGCKVSIESINKQDLPKANGDISGIARDIQMCNDCFIQTGHGEDHDVKKLDDWAKGATEECLNQLKTAENGVQKLSVGQNDKEKFPAPSLPKLGVLKSSMNQNNDGTQRAIRKLEVIKGALEEYIPWLAIKKDCSVTPPEQKPCCDQCQQNYGVALDCTKSSIESINKQDIPKAKCDINGIVTNVQICTDCFAALGNREENIKGIDWWAKKATQQCLDNLNTAENGVQKLSVNQNDKEELPVAPPLPKIGVQKSSVDQNNEAAKVTIERLEGIKPHIEGYKEWFGSRKACGLTPPEAKKCCGQCQKDLGDAIKGVKVSIESVKKQDYPKANCDITAIATDIQKCNDCFVHTPNGEDSCAKKFYMWAKGATDDCLVHLKNAEIEAREL